MELKLHSDEIDKLTQAFTKATLEINGFEADKSGNYGPYVTINSIRRTSWNILANHGLKVWQGRTVHNGQLYLVTRLMHISGQWEASYTPQNIPSTARSYDQALGIAMSYQRRYDLYGLFGILGEDSDPESKKEREIELINESEFQELWGLLGKDPQVEKDVCKVLGIQSLEYLPRAKYADLKKQLKD